MYYKMVDKKAGVFAKWRVSDDSAARMPWLISTVMGDRMAMVGRHLADEL